MILLQGAAKASQEVGGGFGKLPGNASRVALIVVVSDRFMRGVEMRKASQRCVAGGIESPCCKHRSGIGL